MSELVDSLFADDASEGAAWGLLALMTGLSEECWCASWMSGMEFDLWAASAGKPFGQFIISERQSVLLRLLSEEAGGWWIFDAGPKFVRTDEWLKIVSARGQS